MKPKQEVRIELVFDGDPPYSGVGITLEGTNIGNLRSKVKAVVDKLLVQYNMSQGATMTIRFAKAEVDEFANPER